MAGEPSSPPAGPTGSGASFLRDVFRGAGGTVLSRVFGLVRDASIAYAFGASAGYDAFLVALYIPQALRQILGEGGLASAFLPVYARQGKGGEAEALARSALVWLALLLPVVCVLGAVLAPAFLPILAAGFAPDTMSQSIVLTRWLFPLIAFISVAALAGGILNAHGRFFLPALAPAVLNVGMIAGAIVLRRFTDPPVLGLALGALFGGAGMAVLLLPAVRSIVRGPWKLWPPHPALRDVAWRLLPALGALVVAELNTLVDNRLASYLVPGSIATLQYAMRLFQLPLGVLAVSVTAAALPRLSRLAAERDEQGFRRALRHGFLTTGALILPSVAGLLVLRTPIVSVLFERGAFTSADTARTALTLVGYLTGLWAYALVYLLSRAWFALGRPFLPVLAGAVSLAVNIALNLWWVRLWGTFGLALATGTAGWVYALVLGGLLWRTTKGWIPLGDTLRLFTATGGMAVGILVLQRLFAGWTPWVAVGAGVSVGVVLYSLLVWGLGLRRALVGER